MKPTALKGRDAWRIDPAVRPLLALARGKAVPWRSGSVTVCPVCGTLHRARDTRPPGCTHHPGPSRLNVGYVVEIACRALCG